MRIIFTLVFLVFLINNAFSELTKVVDLDQASVVHDTPDTSENSAIDWSVLYIGDGVYGFSGPYKRHTTMLDNLLFNVTLDGEKLFKIKGNTTFLSVIGIWGG